MTILRRTMLAGGVNEKFLPDSQKLIYIASAKVDPKKGSLGSQVVLNKFNEADGHGIIATSKDITEIKDSAFEKSDKLLEVILPEGLMSIGQYAFQNCRGLSSIRIPISISDIKEYAFYNIAYNTSVYISDLSAWCKINFEHGANPLSTGKLYLNNEEITELVIPSDITKVKDYTFSGYAELIEVTLHDNIESIGDHSFSGCTNLTSITIPDSVVSLQEGVFYNCGFNSFIFPKSIRSVNYRLFEECKNLIKITFPSNITIIYDKAFYHCTSLGVCDFSAQTSVPSVSGYNTFTSVPNTCKFVVPDHLYDEWITSYRWDGYADQIIKKSD